MPTEIRLVEETGSTNADLSDALRAGEEIREGNWLVTRRQTAGKGRQGREWYDGSGNFMGSTVVDPRPVDPPAATLSFVASLAVASAVEQALRERASVQLKWPNDVLIDGAKSSGILLEMVRGHVVVGIGVNLANAPNLPERKTTSLLAHGATVSVEEFANSLIPSFRAKLRIWRERGLEIILDDFKNRSVHAPGDHVRVHDIDGTRVEGSFAGLEPDDGALRLCLADGSERVIRAGDVI